MSTTSKVNTKAGICLALFLSGCGEQPAVVNLRTRINYIRGQIIDIRSRILDRPSKRIDSLFQIDTFQSNRAYIENRIGPAKYVRGGMRTYVVDGCTVLIGYSHDAVRNLGIDGVSRRCQFPLKRFDQNAPEKALAEMSFGDLVSTGRAGFFISWSCVSGCGNAVDPNLEVLVRGPHSDNFIDILATEKYPYRNTSEFSKATFALEQRLKKQKKYAVGQLCIYGENAASLTSNVSIQSIRVGYDLEEPNNSCEMKL